MHILFVGQFSSHPCIPALQQVGHVLEFVPTGADALQFIQAFQPDALLVADQLPDTALLAFIRKLRLVSSMPLLVMHRATPHPEDEVTLLNTGADACLSNKAPSVVSAMVTSAVRRSSGFATSVLQAGDLHLNLSSRLVAVQGQEVRIPPLQFNILQYLMLRVGKLITSEQMTISLYGSSTDINCRSLAKYICQLRKEVVRKSATTDIKTVHRQGYVLLTH